MKIGRNADCPCGSGVKYKKCCELYKDNYRNKNICLLVGNGFTTSFINSSNIKNINSAKPLTSFDCEEISYSSFDLVPQIKDELLPMANSFKNHYDAIQKYISDCKDYSNIINNTQLSYQDIMQIEIEKTIKYCNLRRFLAMSYSFLQFKLDEAFDDKRVNKWLWLNWFENVNNLKFVISFNYDLVLENTLNFLGMSFKRIGSCEERNSLGIPIIKPHGSIDFDLSKCLVANDNILWANAFDLCQTDSVVDIVERRKLTRCRVQADIIPPLQENNHISLDWVKKGFEFISENASKIDVFIIAGFSYSEADRKEMNCFIDNIVDKSIEFIIVNPERVLELENYSINKGYKVTCKNYLPWC